MSPVSFQGLLLFVVRGIAVWVKEARKLGIAMDERTATFMAEAVHPKGDGSEDAMIRRIREAVQIRDQWRVKALSGCGSGCGCSCGGETEALPEYATWEATTDDAIRAKAQQVKLANGFDAATHFLEDFILQRT